MREQRHLVAAAAIAVGERQDAACCAGVGVERMVDHESDVHRRFSGKAGVHQMNGDKRLWLAMRAGFERPRARHPFIPSMDRQVTLTRTAGAIVSSPARGLVLGTTCRALRQWPSARIPASTAFYLREALADRDEVLTGSLATGSRIRLLARDRGHSHIYFYGTYEEPTTRFFHRVAAPGWTVIDVGANAGYYSLLALDLGGPESDIHAFEPNPALVQLTTENAALADGRITVVQKACGSGPGELDLHLRPDSRNSGLATLVPRGDRSETVAVEVVTLDAYCEELGLRPDLVKIDVERFESQVLAGMAGLLERRIPRFIICELSSGGAGPDPADVIHRLDECGYRAWRIRDDGTLGALDHVEFENVCFTTA